MNTKVSMPSILEARLNEALGVKLSDLDLVRCYESIEILEPTPGKLIIQKDNKESLGGIYPILKGKARVLDSQNNFLVSLETRGVLGASNLFPEASLLPFQVRASLQLQLAYLPLDLLQSLIERDCSIREHLYSQAIRLDLFLRCRHHASFENLTWMEFGRVFALLRVYNLPIGSIDPSLQEAVIWLIRKGKLINGLDRLEAGSIYLPEEQNSWQVTEATELYLLRQEDIKTIQPDLPQFGAIFSTSNLVKPDILAKLRTKSTSSFTPAAKPSNAKLPQTKAYFPSPQKRIGHFWQRLMHRYPFYAQQSASDCGAACLVMVGLYWGKRFSLNRIREIARVNRSGSSLKGLVDAAEALGFATKPVKATFEQLSEQKLPAIVHWEDIHYIVVYEMGRNYVIVGDPAFGQKRLSKTEFLRGWTNRALLLEPTTRLKEIGEAAPSSFWQFWELIKPHKTVLSEVFVASLLIQLFALVTPLLTQLLLDRVVVQRSSVSLMAVGLGLLIFGLFRVIMTGLRQYLLDHTSQRVNLALIVGFIRHTFRLPLSFFESRYVGDIMARVRENDKIQRFLTGEALSIFLDLLTVFVYIGFMFWYNWQMALLVLTIVPPFFLLAIIATPFLQKISRQIFNASAKEESYLIEALTGVTTVKSMALEQRVRWHWEELLNRSITTNFSGQIIGNQLQIFSATIEVGVTTAILWFGAWQVIQNQLTIGQLVAFNMLLGNVINPFQRLTILWHQLQEVVIAIERINDVLDAEPEQDLHQKPRQILPALRGHLVFQKVSFRYHCDSEQNILENLSFEVKPGQTIALVGRSGSGKTTIAKLILGLYEPTSGKILIDGRDITTISLQSLREHIGVVDRANFLFGNTIRENIAIAHPEATLAEIREAAIQAGANEFIERLPLGYETPIGERGGTLSGGQCQRLAIARALLGNPSLLILDEATSNLDAESERIIQNNLQKILQGRTTIVIAHRLSTIRHADVIIVIDRGVIVESGTHEALMKQRGHYFYLNQQQITLNN
jgi:ATP-binding cassette, subfamily B, bacterial HlyB/CyaB